jgi:biopolymer transport protein ExbD
MSRKKRKSNTDEEVTLNLAAMLDMAFQLLTFFIMTFRPAPVEGEILLRMPPAQALAAANAKVDPGDTKSNDPAKGFNTLGINLTSDPNGKLTSVSVGQSAGLAVDDGLKTFDIELGKLLNQTGNPFDQVVISVPPELHYSELLRVIGVCTRQTYYVDGQKKKLDKLSVVDAVNKESQ